MRCEGDAPADVKATLGGRRLEGVDFGLEIPEENGWHELRFRPSEIPAGDHEFEIEVSNPGEKPLVVNFDDLYLRIKGAPARKD